MRVTPSTASAAGAQASRLPARSARARKWYLFFTISSCFAAGQWPAPPPYHSGDESTSASGTTPDAPPSRPRPAHSVQSLAQSLFWPMAAAAAGAIERPGPGAEGEKQEAGAREQHHQLVAADLPERAPGQVHPE